MRTSTQRSLLRACFPVGLAAIAVGAAVTAYSAQTGADVVIKNFDFSPMQVSIPAGGSVTWRNLDGEPHTVTSLDGLFRSGGLDQNDSFTFKFTKAGVYSYVCSIHPKMMASVVVK